MTDLGPSSACVVGWPISHSRSPLIHRYWLRTHGIEGDYDRVAVPPEEFADFLTTIGRTGPRGANVTVPHKETAFALCDRLTDEARAVGAVNTLWRSEGMLVGDNTDVHGFLANLDERAPNWRETLEVALVLGAGGAARAVVHGLLTTKVKRVHLVNRSEARARALASTFGDRVLAHSWDRLPELLPSADLLVNTTSLGMSGQAALDIDLRPLKVNAVVCDIVYMPLRTALLERASSLGHPTVDGLGMLLHQAVSGFERWFGVRPRVTAELRAILEKDILEAGQRSK